MEEKGKTGKGRKTAGIRLGGEWSLAIAALSLKLPYGTGAFWEHFDGWGTDMLVMALGLAGIFFIAGKSERRKRPCLKLACCLFSLFTVVGRSFLQFGSWDVLFEGKVQACKALVIFLGYFLIYKNTVLFGEWLVGWLRERKPQLFRSEVCGRVESWLFDRHSFWGVVLTLWILELPWLICFFPGSLEPDAWGQLHMNFGVEKLTAHDPLVVTKLMGMLMTIGRSLGGGE